MTETDVTQMLLFLSASYGRQFDYPSGDDSKDTLKEKVWHEQLKAYNKVAVQEAVKVYISAGHQWPPNPGQIIAQVRKLTELESISGAEAWHMVIRAIDRYSVFYRPDEVRAALPPEVWDAAVIVGLNAISACSPGDTYLMTHFCRVFEQQLQIRQERALFAPAREQIGGGRAHARITDSDGPQKSNPV